MEPTDKRRLLLARRAYELGRLRSAAKVLVFIGPMVLFSTVVSHAPTTTAALGAILCVVAVGLLWRGQVYGRAVGPGLVAGALPLVLPLLVRSGGHCCVGGACWPMCLPACILGGGLAGVVLGLRASRQNQAGESGIAFVVAAGAVAGLAGSLGCIVVGAAGVAGMLASLIITTGPFVVSARLRA